MNVQKIKGKIGRGLAGIVLGSGLVAGVSGCETGMETSLLGTIISGGALGPGVTAQQAAGYELLGSGIQTAGQVQAIENSRSRTTVNVYDSRGEIENVQRPMTAVEIMQYRFKNHIEGPFSCNSWIDNNNDGVIQSEELYGIEKKTFRTIEPVLVGCLFYNRRSNFITRKVYNPQGNLVDETNSVCPSEEEILCINSQNLSPGTYTFQWYINGKFFKEMKVPITE
jgi:hypothetical protein